MNTTNSRHRFTVHKNLIEQMEVRAANQVWVSDITYLRTIEGFCYLGLITDVYSRKIIGYDISDSLELDGCIRALKVACSHQSFNNTNLIHHSDRGIQYCSKPYVSYLRAKEIKISMADKGNCYQNALAERVNGILKNEFNLDHNFKTKNLAVRAALNAIKIYNNFRPHLALGYMVPNNKYAA